MLKIKPVRMDVRPGGCQKNKLKNSETSFLLFGFRHWDLLSFQKRQSGFTLLIAVILSSLLLSIGIAIFNFTYKSIELSALGRESQFAFFSADSGLECALYHDVKFGAFSTSTESIPESNPLFCNGVDIRDSLEWNDSVKTPTSAETTFSMEFDPEDYCAIVVVKKYLNAIGTPTTEIESRGYNSCDPDNRRRVERALRMIYE